MHNVVLGFLVPPARWLERWLGGVALASGRIASCRSGRKDERPTSASDRLRDTTDIGWYVATRLDPSLS